MNLPELRNRVDDQIALLRAAQRALAAPFPELLDIHGTLHLVVVKLGDIHAGIDEEIHRLEKTS